MATTTSDPFFISILPNCIDYAEQRIYRELDILNTRERNYGAITTPGVRLVNLASTVMVVETLAIITPAGSAPNAGQRNICLPVTHDFLDMVYPNESTAYQAVPRFFAMLNQQQVLVGPAPDQAYTVETVGTYRPLPLSATNTTTILTQLLPDLFLAASMIFMSGYQRNFGSQADDPKMGMSWEQQYQELMKWAKNETERQ
ncbi:MAG TPA: hypothetical protein PKX13_11970, partial [Acidiphilium sp.]|nr:hypothetical protein [Acidiphilium sp.]